MEFLRNRIKEYWDDIRSMKAIPQSTYSTDNEGPIMFHEDTSNDKYFPLSMRKFLNDAIRESNTRTLNRQMENEKNFIAAEKETPFQVMDYSFGQKSHEPIDTYFKMLYPSNICNLKYKI